MESAKRQRPETETMRVEDVDALDCGVCCHALKPPIFQCNEGHLVCSSCREKLALTGKCHVCGTSTRSGYLRCRGMERLVETVRVTCPNAAHGCNEARMIYYDLADHCKVCPHGPCYCPGEDCDFIGTTKQLVDHIAGSHDWPCTTMAIMPLEMHLCLQDGFNFLIVDRILDIKGTTTTSSATGMFLFLLDVDVDDEPLGRTISFFCIRPGGNQGPSSVPIKCSLGHSRLLYRNGVNVHHYLHSDLSAECTDLSDGFPCIDECFKFVVPNSALGDEENGAINVNMGISIVAS